MPTYHDPLRVRVPGLSLLGSLILLVACASGATAQQRRYLVELGAAGAYQSYGSATNLKSAMGGLGRIGLWLPLNFSVELEGATAGSETETAPVTDVSVRTFAASVLYNIPVGSRSFVHLKAGGGSTKYGDDCPASAPRVICGSSGTLIGGAGFRIGVTPTLMVRTEGLLSRNKSVLDESVTNFGMNVGLSLMLGSKAIDDSDGDGILNNRDRCANTPSGAQVDGRGCPSDEDNDGVPNGVDRCPTTAPGADVDPTGCTRDSDGDNIADGLDRCPDTPAGVLVDPSGCPRDSDNDQIADGIDRCSETPRGATVDALGCPGDEDGDGVLDGLDRCPRTAVGARVQASGCAEGQVPGRPVPSEPPSAAAPSPSQVTPAPGQRPPTQRAPAQPPPGQRRAPPAAADSARPPARPGTIAPGVIEGVGFAPGTARLNPGSYVALDSLVRILVATPRLQVEIAAHTDNAGTAAENLHLTNLQAEAVRNYLVTKGVPFQQVVPRGYGATVPLTGDTTPRGRIANRRIEIRPVQAGP